MFGNIPISLDDASRIANKKSISISFTFNRQAHSVISVSYSVYDGFVNRDIWIFGLFNKSATWIAPLICFEESSFFKKGSHITNLLGYGSTKSSFECGQATPLRIFNCGFKAEQADVRCRQP